MGIRRKAFARSHNAGCVPRKRHRNLQSDISVCDGCWLTTPTVVLDIHNWLTPRISSSGLRSDALRLQAQDAAVNHAATIPSSHPIHLNRMGQQASQSHRLRPWDCRPREVLYIFYCAMFSNCQNPWDSPPFGAYKVSSVLSDVNCANPSKKLEDAFLPVTFPERTSKGRLSPMKFPSTAKLSCV